MKQLEDHLTLTMYEFLGLQDQEINLTDAHPRYTPVDSQREILKQLAQHYSEAERISYNMLCRRFEHAFYTLACQPTALALKRPSMLCYSASLCIQIVASYLRSQKWKVALLEPIFDNVSGILKAERVELVPLPEGDLMAIDHFLQKHNVQAMWITLPNNPTGMILSENAYCQLVKACQKRGVMLVCDFCFRFFADEMAWDQYAILEESGITYAVIEDTGKTWPTLDLKVGILQSSADIYHNLYYFYDNHLLNVSPFIIQLLIKLIEDTQKRGLNQTVRKVIRQNRTIVEHQLRETLLQCQPAQALVSVAWLKIMNDSIGAGKLWELCRQTGIYVLPGSNFFWHTPALGDQFLRLSLVRDVEVMQLAMERLRSKILHTRN